MRAAPPGSSGGELTVCWRNNIFLCRDIICFNKYFVPAIFHNIDNLVANHCHFKNDFLFWFVYCCLLGIFHCYMEYAALKGEAGADVTLQQLGFQTDFSVYLQIRQTWLAFSQYSAHSLHVYRCFISGTPTWPLHPSPLVIILAIVEVIIILVLIFLRKRLLIAVALIKEASRSDIPLELRGWV